MTLRRQLQTRQASLHEIREIMSSMRTLALIETHKLARSIDEQNKALELIRAAAADFLAFYPVRPVLPRGGGRVFLIIGSDRGFCGDYNERLLDRLTNLAPDTDKEVTLIGVGRKLEHRLGGDVRLSALIDGANAAEELGRVISEVVAELNARRRQAKAFDLDVLYNEPSGRGVACETLLPPFQTIGELPRPRRTPGHPPLLNLGPLVFFTELVDSYLSAALSYAFMAALLAENHQRMEHLDGAVHRLDEQRESLALKCNSLRQEEITEELEIIMSNALFLSESGKLASPGTPR